MSRKNSYFDTSVLNRLKKVLGITSDSDLAEFLEVKPTVIANWRSRERINTTRVLSKCESLDVNWILYGKPKSAGSSPTHQRYEEQEEIVERTPSGTIQVQEEHKEISERLREKELENVHLRSKIEALEDLIIRLKKVQSN